MHSPISIGRVYEPSSPDDGLRVLVDRLWPRGLSKNEAAVDLWPKDITPSSELRKLYHSGSMSWDDFYKAYQRELNAADDALQAFEQTVSGRCLRLLTAAKNLERNHAVVLREVLLRRARG
ncbi:DUF488 domain-containing protein [Lutibaculum baratangense]|uniref:Uroporphyrin-III c-methyltransferase n=1 Tax=Lutibaculum baratangense AMV1 TaxID=631454 RepID=V4RDI7_9HYPH|nr:DUF488 family protein [Lutibaculum baratangense]ESR23424.1 hypothetical protein N177_3492 [Lutibaculum baratangense AMV1]